MNLWSRGAGYFRKKYGIDEEGIYQSCKAFLSACNGSVRFDKLKKNNLAYISLLPFWFGDFIAEFLLYQSITE